MPQRRRAIRFIRRMKRIASCAAARGFVKIAVARQMINFIQIARPFFRLKNGFARRIAGRSQIIFPIVVRIRPLAANTYVREYDLGTAGNPPGKASHLNKVDHCQRNRDLHEALFDVGSRWGRVEDRHDLPS